jgi:hypothetical protein
MTINVDTPFAEIGHARLELDRSKAALTVCGHAESAADAAELLEMLGLVGATRL